MDKNSILGFVLMALVLIGFMYLSKPSEAQQQQEKRYNDSIEAQKQKTVKTHEDSVTLAQNNVAVQKVDSTKLFGTSLKGTESFTTLENNLIKVILTNKGGQVYSVVLKRFKDQKKQPLVLFKGSSEENLNMFFYDNSGQNIASEDHFFVPVNKTDSSVIMRLYADSSRYIDFAYTLHKNDYMLSFDVKAVNVGNSLSPKAANIDMVWMQKARQVERSKMFENRYTNIAFKPYGNGVHHMSDTKDEDNTPQNTLQWIGYKNQYFSSVIIADNNFTKGIMKSRMEDNNSNYLKNYNSTMSVAFDPTGKNVTQMRFYFGPNDYKMLKRYDKGVSSSKQLHLDDIVYLGWTIFHWINQYFTINLFDLLKSWGLSMGIVLLLLTLIVKGLVYPLTYKSYISSARMRVLKPQIDELNKKYPDKDDALKKQQETMAIYNKYGVSPMSGCLPMLLQTPIWMALFFFVPSAIELRGQKFLWADDLSAYDNLIHWNTNIPLLGNHLSLFCLLMTIFTILNTKYNMQQQDTGGQQQQQMASMKWMMYIMPVIFLFMLNNYAAGLNYYYCISSVVSILTMILLRKVIKDEDILAKLKKFAADPTNTKKRSGMMARLEQMQKEQQQLAADRAKHNRK